MKGNLKLSLNDISLDDLKFKDAFRIARARGDKTFIWRDKSFTTKYLEEVANTKKPTPKEDKKRYYEKKSSIFELLNPYKNKKDAIYKEDYSAKSDPEFAIEQGNNPKNEPRMTPEERMTMIAAATLGLPLAAGAVGGSMPTWSSVIPAIAAKLYSTSTYAPKTVEKTLNPYIAEWIRSTPGLAEKVANTGTNTGKFRTELEYLLQELSPYVKPGAGGAFDTQRLIDFENKINPSLDLLKDSRMLGF